LDGFVEHLRHERLEVLVGGPELCADRRVQRLVSCVDPIGLRHEFYVGAYRAHMADAFRSKVLKGRFSTGRLGIGHLVAVAGRGEPMVDFYQRVLRLKISDYISSQKKTGGPSLDATFFHSATGRHHSIATAAMPGFPKRIHHLMLEVEDMDDVGLAHDRCVKAGVPILMGLGHHPNDRMFSFYMQTPSGFALEYGWGGIVIDDDVWEIKRFSQLSDWGHQPPGARAD